MRAARVLERAAAPLAGLSAAIFAGLSRVRGKRFFHPRGVTFRASIAFTDDPPLPFVGVHDAVVRLSRGIGLPENMPDVLGLAVKIPAYEQDLLFATSGERAVSRHLLAPSSGFYRRPYSTVLPYEWNGELIVLGARADGGLVALRGDRFDDVIEDVATRPVSFDLTWGPAGSGEVKVFASISLRELHHEDVVFNPFNSGSGLKPAGALNRLRRETYLKSQQARPDAIPTYPE